MSQSNYSKYRGRCKELSEEACANDPDLVLVRGHYFCPIWNRDNQHWWCVRKSTGEIFDPSCLQFPSAGAGIYEPFNNIVTCAECGKEVLEEEAQFEGRYAFCSTRCRMRFVGLENFVK